MFILKWILVQEMYEKISLGKFILVVLHQQILINIPYSRIWINWSLYSQLSFLSKTYVRLAFSYKSLHDVATNTSVRQSHSLLSIKSLFFFLQKVKISSFTKKKKKATAVIFQGFNHTKFQSIPSIWCVGGY